MFNGLGKEAVFGYGNDIPAKTKSRVRAYLERYDSTPKASYLLAPRVIIPLAKAQRIVINGKPICNDYLCLNLHTNTRIQLNQNNPPMNVLK
jgi:hypothetical protein